MRYYIIILSELDSKDNDQKFADIIDNNKWEWWRYTALNWILATPDSVSTNQIINYAFEAYGPSFITALEITINDVGGIFPASKEYYESGGKNPFLWFNEIRDPKFIPRWEREKKEKDKK